VIRHPGSLDADPGVAAVAGARPRPPLLVIRPTRGWRAIDVREIWRFRDLLIRFAIRDVKLRYRQTALGVLWVILQPVLGAAIFAMVFGRVARLPTGGVPYFPFAFAGLLGWNLFQGTLSRAGNSLVSNAHLIPKVFFPRIILPLAAACSALLDFFVSCALMLVVLLVSDIRLTPALLLLPLLIVVLQLLGLGLSFGAAALSVRYRDIVHILPVATQLLLYASPVAYHVAAVPHNLRAVYELNPLAGLLEALRWSLLGSAPPSAGQMAYSVAASGLVFLAGALAFRRLERGFADVI
jgi:lipopolysaccharide transport system permease protein